jgi:hypothetical protein
MGTGGSLIVIDFSEQGNSAHFRAEGWSGQEPGRVWGIGPRSALRVPIQSSGRPMMLEAEIGPNHGPPEVTGQIVNVRVNGTVIGGVRLEALSVIRCSIDPVIARPDGILEIEFECPGFHVPAWLGVSGDQRSLSCWFTFVRLYTTDMFEPGPHFPASDPAIPVIGLSPPFAGMPDANARVAPEVYTFGLPVPSEREDPDSGENEFSVAEGASDQLKLLAPRTPGAYLLRVDAFPLIASGGLPNLNVTILLDGIVIGQVSVDEPTSWVMPLPRELTEKRDILRLNFMVSEARGWDGFGPPEDTRPNRLAVTRVSILPAPSYLTSAGNLRAGQTGIRPIAVSARFLMDDASTLPATVEAALGTDLTTLLRGFESLGTDHEFGVVQRKLGLDVLNLFRFCEGSLAGLLQALTDDVRLALDPGLDRLEPSEADPAGHALRLPPYDLYWQTFVVENDADPETWRHANAVTLGFLRRKFCDGLRAGRKIYVLKRRRSIPIDQAAVFLIELSRTGPATLLCVEEASAARPPGEVELLLPGLMRGYVGRFAPATDVGSADPADWLRVLANAALLKREPNAIVAA